MENLSEKTICRRLRKGIHFYTTDLRACCANVCGPIYSELKDISNIDWDKIVQIRQDLIRQFEAGETPPCCEGCPDAAGIKSFQDIESNGYNNNKIDLIQINNFYACNSSCIYCVNKADINFETKKKPRYAILPLLKDLEKRNILENKMDVLLTGGEPTCLSDIDKILKFFRKYDCTYHIFTSGIDYKKDFEKLFKENRVIMILSLDSGCRETYKKIKQVDKFDKIIKNLQQYIKKAPSAVNQIRMKYIFLEGINDNKEEIEKFLNLVHNLRIRNVEISIDYHKKYADCKYPVPAHFNELLVFFKSYAEKLRMNIITTARIRMIFEKGNII